jgi:hypothetical protein
MKNLVLAVLLMAAAAPARATSTSRLLGLDIIPVGTLSWGPRDNNRIYQISSAAASQYDSNTFGLNGSTQTSRGAWLFNNGSSITFATGSAFYLAPATAYTSTITAAGIAEAYGVTASTMGIGGSPSGTRKFQVYFNANNNSPSYGDGAVRYLDSVNGVGFECGALYGGSQPSWCQSGNDGMGSKKPFVFQPDGSNVGIRTLSPATTAALEVAGPVSVGGSGNTQYSLQASSGASFGSDLHVTGTLEATKLKGDGSQITGIGGGGTVTTQGSPAAGQVAVFQAGTVISTNFEVMIASIDVYQVYNATFDALTPLIGGGSLVFQSSTSYRLHWNLKNESGSSSGYFVQVSTDSPGRACDNTANYGTQNVYFNSGASSNGGSLTPSYFAWPLYGDANQVVQVNAGGTSQGDMNLETIYGSSTTWHEWGRGYNETSNGAMAPDLLAGYYKLGKPITSLCITGSSGYFSATLTRNQKFSAHLELWRGNTHN